MLDKLAYHLTGDCKRTSISQIIHDELHYHKVSVWWVPQYYTRGHKSKRLAGAICFENLNEDEDDLLACNIIGNKTWLYHFTLELELE